MKVEGRTFNFGDYRFGFNGKEADSNQEWGSATHYDYGFRIYNPSIGKFLSVDPLAPDYPWYTPYQFSGNKPIAFVDLDGLEEYSSYEEYKMDKGDAALEVMNGSDGAWLSDHREIFQAKFEVKYSFSEKDRSELYGDSQISGVFSNAAQANLESGNSSNYTTIGQRTNFYRWAQDKANSEGYGVRWPGAAAGVAANIDKADDAMSLYSGFSNDEAAIFANSGNKAIFNDAFPKLQLPFSNQALTGLDAMKWDMQTLAEEQTLIQPLYLGLTAETSNLLSGLAKQTNPFVDLAVKTPKFHGELLSITDRWLYGLNNAGYKNLTKEDIPEVSNKYKDGSQLESVLEN